MAINTDYGKTSASLRGWLLGKGYHQAIKAMEWAKSLHTGRRRDKVTPEFSHQVMMANFARTICDYFLEPENVFTTIFLHDLVEDKGVTLDQISEQWGNEVCNAVASLTNQVANGAKKEQSGWFHMMGYSPVASIVKGIDRIHNQSTMVDVFRPDKIDSYMAETEKYILPMLKAARKAFPEQESAYQNIRFVLMLQLDMISTIQESRKEQNETPSSISLNS
jgi:(p)ppGpp synthase/HD superfamily hydrolase